MLPFGLWYTSHGTLKLIEVDVNTSENAVVQFEDQKKHKAKIYWDGFRAYINWNGDKYYLDDATNNREELRKSWAEDR